MIKGASLLQILYLHVYYGNLYYNTKKSYEIIVFSKTVLCGIVLVNVCIQHNPAWFLHIDIRFNI